MRSWFSTPDAFFVVWRSGILKHTLPICRFTKKPFAVNQDLKVFTPLSKKINSEYVRCFMSTNSEVIRQSCVKAGTTVESINTDQFMEYPISLPEMNHQKEIVNLEATISRSVNDAESHVNSSKLILKSLINEIF